MLLLLSQLYACGPGAESASHFADHELRGALVTTRFASFDALKDLVDIKYFNEPKPRVELIHSVQGKTVKSILEEGVSQTDIEFAQKGELLDKLNLVLNCPFILLNKNEVLSVYYMGKRKNKLFGEGDVAFFDLAKQMVQNIHALDKGSLSSSDLGEKGLLNTFNHIIAQSIMTSLFSEELADFIADVHERYNMPELITGEFNEAQIENIKFGPVDNYVDMVNNEWGQELGKLLKQKYKIHADQDWTPLMLENYLNDIQAYFSWALQIGFEPFSQHDEIIKKFVARTNKILKDANKLEEAI